MARGNLAFPTSPASAPCAKPGTSDRVGRARGGTGQVGCGREWAAAGRGGPAAAPLVSQPDEHGERDMEIITRPRSRRWRVAGVRLLLAASVVAVGLLLPASLGLSQGVVSDDAMSGSVARGSLLLGRPVQTVDQLRVGDVISFADPGDPTGERRVTRRVVAIAGPTVRDPRRRARGRRPVAAAGRPARCHAHRGGGPGPRLPPALGPLAELGRGRRAARLGLARGPAGRAPRGGPRPRHRPGGPPARPRPRPEAHHGADC